MESNIIKHYSHSECTVCKNNIKRQNIVQTKTENFCINCNKLQIVTHYYTTTMAYGGLLKSEPLQTKFTLAPATRGNIGEHFWSDMQNVQTPQGIVQVTVTKINNEYVFDIPTVLYDFIMDYEFQRKPVSKGDRISITTINDFEFNDICKIFNFKIGLKLSQTKLPFQYAQYTGSTCKNCNNSQKLPGDYKTGNYNCVICGSLDDWKHNYNYSSETTIKLHKLTLDTKRWISYEFALFMVTEINKQYVYEFILPEQMFNVLVNIDFEYYKVKDSYHIVVQNNDDLMIEILRALHWTVVFPKEDKPIIINDSKSKPETPQTTLYPMLSDDGITYYGQFGFNNYYQIWYIPGNRTIELLVSYEIKELLEKFHNFVYVKTDRDMYLCSFNKTSLSEISHTLRNKFVLSEEYPVKQTNTKPIETQEVHLEPGPLNNGDYVGSWFDADLPQTQVYLNRIVRYSNGDTAKPQWRIWVVNPLLPKIVEMLENLPSKFKPTNKKRTYFTSSSSWKTNQPIVEITFTNEFPIDKLWRVLAINPVIKNHELIDISASDNK